jgi:hypothetical protein
VKEINMKKIHWLLLVLIITGCSSSRITTSWKAENAGSKKYSKILVLGLVGEPDRRMRDKMEQHMAGDLKDLGYNAVTSVEAYGPKAFENMTEADAIKLLFTEDIAAVVTIVLLNKEKEAYYLSSPNNHPRFPTYQDRFWNYYSRMHDRIYSPAYYTVDTRYFWESNLYDLSDWRLLYSVQSQSFTPGSTENLAHEYGQMIIKDMVKNNVLQKQVIPLKPF